MIDFSNIFDEEEDNIFTRFSSVVFFVFIYYSLSYYFLINNKDKCLQKPKFINIFILIILHIIHVIVLKVLHNNELYSYMWILAILPLILFMFYNKYEENRMKREKEKMDKMYEQFKHQQQPTEVIRNATPQKPQAPPMQGQHYVGIHNNGVRKGDNIPYHQQQHTDPLPPQIPDQSMVNIPQIANQPQMSEKFMNDGQYDSQYIQNMRPNNTITEPIQPIQKLDMNEIGGNAGSSLFDGFDPYGSSFSSF